MFDYHLELKKTAKAHQKIETIVRFEEALCWLILHSSQRTQLAANV